MRDDEQEIQSQAAFVLQCLATNTDNRAAIAKVGAIPLLTNLLRSSSLIAGGHAALALANLAVRNSDNKALIAKVGAIPPLVSLLWSNETYAVEQSSLALSNLAVMDTHNKNLMITAGVIPPLIQLLPCSSQKVQRQARALLQTLADDNASNVAAIKKAAADSGYAQHMLESHGLRL